MGFANRGEYAEGKVREYLAKWQKATNYREANRLTDTKSAGRIIKSAAADFEYFLEDCIGKPQHGLIEVKQTEHDYRLARDKVPQLAWLRKREKCGGRSFVVVYHSTIKRWRIVSVPYLANEGDKGSWNLQEFPAYVTCGDALATVGL